MNHVTFIVDGFNLYHSVREASKDTHKSTKWLNIKSLCLSYIHQVGSVTKSQVSLKSIYYFSALATHLEPRDPDIIKRHMSFIKCLKDTGVTVELNQFKPKEIRCPHCKKKFIKYEEKETDVSIALKLIEIFTNNECDTAVLITGDTDLAPPVSTAHRLFPNKKVLFAFPYKRKNRELSRLAPGSFKISSGHYINHQFPDPYRLKDGAVINKPTRW